MCAPPPRGWAERGERATLRSLFFSSRYTPEVFLPLKPPLRQLLFSALPLPPPGSGLSVNKVDPHLRRVILKKNLFWELTGTGWKTSFFISLTYPQVFLPYSNGPLFEGHPDELSLALV